MKPLCIAMAFDAGMLAQARACLATIDAHCPYDFELCVVPIGLAEAELGWLRARGARLYERVEEIPAFPDAPAHARAMTCRPYLPALFPGYDCYLWVDADIRFTSPRAFAHYVEGAREAAVVIAQETDPTYGCVRDPGVARTYHLEKIRRVHEVHGQRNAERIHFFAPVNAGIFAIPAGSPVWDAYRRYLERALRSGYDSLKEQDAMNLAVLDHYQQALVSPPTMNWLCSIALPRLPRRDAGGQWVRPTSPHTPIEVLHLTSSSFPVTVDGEQMTLYDFYRRMSLTS